MCFYTISKIDSSYQIIISYMILFYDLMFSLTVFCVLIPVHLDVFMWIYMHVHVCAGVHILAGVPACVHVQLEARSQPMVVFSTPTLCFEIESQYDLGLTDYASLVG